MGTSHELGQNFARAFQIDYLDETGTQQLCWTTSWGVSTRMMGGLIMAHGDDAGLRVPPRLAATQAVVLVVRDEDGAVTTAARGLVDRLVAAGVRARLDDRISTPFGRRATDWELKGVPVRIEVGPRDLAEGQVVVVRRDRPGKEPIPVEGLAEQVPVLLSSIQQSLHDEALAHRDDRTVDVATVEEAASAAADGFVRIPWAAVGDAGVERLAADAVTVRCLITADGYVPESVEDPDLVAVVARSY
ncbi:MAG: proline--tRNA ligase, partial [Microthrixaceae bacterium]|nr:proline--tRNA ligase [Microthrixaceae bacterium]